MRRARPVWWGLGAKFGRKHAKTYENIDYIVSLFGRHSVFKELSSHAILRRQALTAADLQMGCATYRSAQRNTPAAGGP